jgi:hypothetical protein
MSHAKPSPTLPYALLVAMTIVSFGGPFVIFIVLRGGESARWPPDRWIEWAAITIVMGLFLLLFVACLTIRLWFRPKP